MSHATLRKPLPKIYGSRVVFADPDLVACETNRSTMKRDIFIGHRPNRSLFIEQALEVGADVDGAVLVSIEGKTSVGRTLFVLATA